MNSASASPALLSVGTVDTAVHMWFSYSDLCHTLQVSSQLLALLPVAIAREPHSLMNLDVTDVTLTLTVAVLKAWLRYQVPLFMLAEATDSAAALMAFIYNVQAWLYTVEQHAAPRGVQDVATLLGALTALHDHATRLTVDMLRVLRVKAFGAQ